MKFSKPTFKAIISQPIYLNNYLFLLSIHSFATEQHLYFFIFKCLYLSVSRKRRSSLLDVRNRRGADVDSYHEQITRDIKIKLRCRKKDNTLHRHNRLNVQLLPLAKRFLQMSKVTNVTLRQIAEDKLARHYKIQTLDL